MIPLSLTLPCSPLETPLSYLSRLAARNFAPDILEFAADLDLDFAGLTNGTPDSVRHLCARAGLAGDSFAQTNVLKISTMRYRVGKEEMNIEILDRSSIRFCPECVLQALKRGEQPWEVIHQASWQIIQIRSCPLHGVPLRRDPTTRGDRYCRFDFTRLLAEGRLDLSSGPSGGTADALDLYLAARIYGHHEVNWCAQLPLPALIKAAEVLGVTLNHGREAKASKLDASKRRDAMLTGYEVLSRGQDGIVKRLHDFASATASRSGQDKVWARFGAFQRLLGSDAKMRADLQPLREIVREYFLATYPFKAGTMVLGEEVTEVRILSMRSACRIVGTREAQVQNMLIARGRAERDASGRFRLLTPLTVEIVADLCREASAWLRQAEAIEYLGCSFAMFRQLSESGLLVPAEEKERRIRNGFYQGDLDRLLDSLFAGAPKLDGPPPGCTTLEMATRKVKCNIPDIVRLILDGSIRPVGRLTEGRELQGLLVQNGSIIAMRQAQEQESNGYTVSSVATGLHINPRTAHFLVEEGFLVKRKMKNTRSQVICPMVTAESYREFDAVYCSLGKLRVEVVCSPRQQHCDLRKAGILPVIDGPGRTPVFRRDDLRTAAFLQ